jgi:hypothetical protein
MMNTDLVGGEEFAAKLEALENQVRAGVAVRDAAAQSVKDAKTADTDALSEHFRKRDGGKQPTLKEPKAEGALADSERQLKALKLALRKETDALVADVQSREDTIRASLAEAEDTIDGEVQGVLDDISGLLSAKSEIRAHRDWLRDPSRAVGRREISGLRELTALRSAATGQDAESAKDAWIKRCDAWNALVKRATTGYDRGRSAGDVAHAEIDQRIEAEVARMLEAGEEVPMPTIAKWAQKLGMAVKPKGAGTGLAHIN